MARITVDADVKAGLKKVWERWTEPRHIMRWNQASSDWHCPAAKNDLKEGGKFSATMAAKDGSAKFDFEGTYTRVVPMRMIAYVMPDGRRVNIQFIGKGKTTRVKETFDPEGENPLQMQREGWQSILNSFKRYAESE